MEEFVNKFANGKFIQGLQKWSTKIAQNSVFRAISAGMGGTLCLIMVGAVIQIICAVMNMAFGIKTTDPIYQIMYAPYELTMGLLGFFMCFSMAYNYSKQLGVPMVQSGFIALVCYFLVAAPLGTYTSAAGASVTAMPISGLGSSGIFVGLLIGLVSVRITKFATDHNWVIRMPDVVPEGILHSFNAVIPAAINIIIWYGLSLIISSVTAGAMTLSTLITVVIGVPLSVLVSPAGMVVIVAINQLCWFFGIHGGSVAFTAIMPSYLAAYALNGQLAAAGQPLVFDPVFLYGCLGLFGGTGNTLVLCFMGLKSKSKRISAVSNASIVPGLFNINEPAIFGFPILYNPILFIPFLINPLIIMGFMGIAYYFGLIGYPQVLIMTTLPVFVQQFLATLDWRNVVFIALMVPVMFLTYYPFFKIYERQCIDQETAEAAAEAAAAEGKSA